MPEVSGMSQLERYFSAMDHMEGWFNRESAAIMSMFMDNQTSNGISGNALEIGIWEGKSAALIAAHLDASSETMILVDPFINKNRDKIIENFRAAGANTTEGTVILEQAYSDDVLRDPARLEKWGRYRLVHIDGGHSGSSVYNDLEIANLTLLRNGLVIVDDVFNPAYPQVTEAVYKYMHSRPYDFSIFLIGFNKAYLCRPNAAPAYRTPVKRDIVDFLKNHGFDCTLYKFSSDFDGSAFGIGPRLEDLQYKGDYFE